MQIINVVRKMSGLFDHTLESQLVTHFDNIHGPSLNSIINFAQSAVHVQQSIHSKIAELATSTTIEDVNIFVRDLVNLCQALSCYLCNMTFSMTRRPLGINPAWRIMDLPGSN